MPTIRVSGGGNDSTGNGTSLPYKSVYKALGNSYTVAADTIIEVQAGQADALLRDSLTAQTGFTINTGVTLRVKAYDGGAVPTLHTYFRGFVAQGTGSIVWEDVNLTREVGNAGNHGGLDVSRGGTLSVKRATFSDFFNTLKAGSGADGNNLFEDLRILRPNNSGLVIDPIDTLPITKNGVIRRVYVELSQPTVNDGIVLHDGGYGLATGWLVEDCEVAVGVNSTCENGIDLQQQFRGATIRRNKCRGSYGGTGTLTLAGQAYAEGDIVYKSNNYRSATQAGMLAKWRHMGFAPSGWNTNDLMGGGHAIYVYNDPTPAKNGWYLATGSDLSILAGWTGPLTATDLTSIKNLVYENEFGYSSEGIKVRHPGSQYGANKLRMIRGYVGSAAKGLDLMERAWDILIDGLDIDMEAGSVTDDNPIYIKTLDSNVPQRLRLRARNLKVVRPSGWDCPMIALQSENDLGYVETDRCAYVNDGGTGSFAMAGSTSYATLSHWQSANGFDANSEYYASRVEAGIDSDGELLAGSPLIGAGNALAGMTAAAVVNGFLRSGRVPKNSPPDIGGLVWVDPDTSVPEDPGPGVGDVTSRRAARTEVVPIPPPSPGLEIPDSAPLGFASSGVTASTITVEYVIPEGSQAMLLEIRPSGSEVWVQTYVPTNVASYTFEGLVTGTLYSIRAAGFNAAGAGEYTTPITETPI